MLAADKLLLQSNLKQRAIQLREKELNLFNDKCAARSAWAAQHSTSLARRAHPPRSLTARRAARAASMRWARSPPCSPASR